MANDIDRRRSFTDLSGLWTGYYAYDLTDEAVMFTAWIREENGRLTGSILEENLDAETFDTEYEAELLGLRQGLDVRFTKAALNEETGEALLLRYQGDTDADCCLISGVWFFDDPSDWTGTFMMTRISGAMKAHVSAGTAQQAGDDRGDEG